VHVVEQAGMWSFAQYSPAATTNSEEGIRIAYLQADNPLDSFLSKYRLVIMDRDGSNRHVVFPAQDQPGLDPKSFVWSPDGRQIALIYQGNIILLDVGTGIDQKLTGDGLASSPRWVE
jgi:Tol biopolymer transport system component